MFNVLILCTHNSARSVLAEAMLNTLAGRLGVAVQAYSAGSAPSGRVNPLALEVLAAAGIDPRPYHSKSWDVFCQPDAPPLHLVITVCDHAAAEACPVFVADNGAATVKAHWAYPDPSRAAGNDEARRQAFELTRQALGYRLQQLLALPLTRLSPAALGAAVDAIGKT